MKIKKILALLLVTSMVAALAACGSSSSDNTATDEAAVEETATDDAAAPAADAAAPAADVATADAASGDDAGAPEPPTATPATGNGASSEGGDTSQEAYNAYLYAYIDACPDIADETQKNEFKACVDAGTLDVFPAEMLFGGWFAEDAMTYDAFVAANGAYTLPF